MLADSPRVGNPGLKLANTFGVKSLQTFGGKAYLMWYRVLGEEVTVLACTHARQNPSKITSRF